MNELSLKFNKKEPVDLEKVVQLVSMVFENRALALKVECLNVLCMMMNDDLKPYAAQLYMRHDHQNRHPAYTECFKLELKFRYRAKSMWFTYRGFESGACKIKMMVPSLPCVEWNVYFDDIVESQLFVNRTADLFKLLTEFQYKGKADYEQQSEMFVRRKYGKSEPVC